MKNKKLLIPGILIVGIIVGFFGGYKFKNCQIDKTRNAFVGGGDGTAQRFVGGARPVAQDGNGLMNRGGGAISGTILSIDEKSLTVKLADGSTKIVLFSDSATYSNTISAQQTDLKVGSEIAVFGSTNSDGSVTATSVQINPNLFKAMGSPPPFTDK